MVTFCRLHVSYVIDCLISDKYCVEPTRSTIHCDGTNGFKKCYFDRPPGIVGTLISVVIAANPTNSECNPLGFGTNPPGYPMTAPGIYGYDSDSMYANSGCIAYFEGCFAGILYKILAWLKYSYFSITVKQCRDISCKATNNTIKINTVLVCCQYKVKKKL